MTAADFVRHRQRDWNELERLLGRGRAPGRPFKGSPSEISRFADLFRNVCADLARARAMGYPDNLVDYLNALAARSHNIFYAAPPLPKHRFWSFFTTVFPSSVRNNVVYVVAALLLFYGPLAGMIGLAATTPETLYQIVPLRVLKGMEQMHSGSHDAGRSEDQDVAMTGFYIRNNIGIAFGCFASGIFFGLGSLLVLLFNGILIGATLGYVVFFTLPALLLYDGGDLLPHRGEEMSPQLLREKETSGGCLEHRSRFSPLTRPSAS